MPTTTPHEARTRLLAWVEANANAPADSTSPLVGTHAVLDSLALISLTLLIEELRGRAIDPEDYADLDRFSTVDSILRHYFPTGEQPGQHPDEAPGARA
ncbi:hypothetical protein ACFC6L_18620 [Kitasatospora phosalacinea]|uniref:hypothetical protein n=1 Tax=Kitasatospora phosalacinea TaxID=2065 RepID=UPI0035DA7FAE